MSERTHNDAGEPLMSDSQYRYACALDAQADGWDDREDDGQEDHRTTCAGCGLVGDHDECIDEPEAPDLLWFCSSCWDAQHPSSAPRGNVVFPFEGELL